MSDGIAKGVGESLGNLGKQIITDVAKMPAQIVGLDETMGSGGGKSQKGQTNQKPKMGVGQNSEPDINRMAQEDEIKKQQELQQARRLLSQISGQPVNSEPTVYEQIQRENAQKKEDLKNRQQAENMQLKQVSTRPRRGNLMGKQTGSETKKNVVAQ
jgi:hypothetical protein